MEKLKTVKQILILILIFTISLNLFNNLISNLKMIFSCCFKPAAQDQSVNNLALQANLLGKDKQIQRQNTQVQVLQEKLGHNHVQHVKRDEKYPAVVNHNLEKMQDIESYCTAYKHQQINRCESQNRSINLPKSLKRLPSHQQQKKTKNRSHIWLQADNKILYFSQQINQEMVMAYKIVHRKAQSQLFDYVLKTQRRSNKIKNKTTDLSLCLVFFTQSISKLKSLTANLIPNHNLRPIFGVLKRQTQQKSAKSHYQTDLYIHDIIIVRKNSIRLQVFQRIIIALNSQKDSASVMAYCEVLTQQFQLQDLRKLTFIFPPFMTLGEINTILVKMNRKFLLNQNLEKVANYLSFQVELFQNFQEALIVGSYESINMQKKEKSREFQTKLELAIGLLMIEIDDSNSKFFQAFIQNFLINKSISEYLKLRQFLHQGQQQFLSKLQTLAIFDSLQLEEISKGNKIQQNVINSFQKTIRIKYRHKKKIGFILQDYQKTKISNEKPISKKQWDDDLKENDIRATILDKPTKQLESDCNIFEVIDDSYVQTGKLDIASDEDQILAQKA